MKKVQLIEAAAQTTGMTKKGVGEVYNALIEAIEGALKNGENVQLPGFGIFAVKEVKAHTGRNPKTNAAVMIPASRRVTFSVSKTLKDKVNK